MVRAAAMLALSISFIACTGCAMEWTKPGATEQEINADKLSCEQEAQQKYPVTLTPTAHYRPPLSSKLDPTCVPQSGFTSCDSMSSPGAPSSASHTDTNDYNRAAAVKACLTTRGYKYKRVER